MSRCLTRYGPVQEDSEDLSLDSVPERRIIKVIIMLKIVIVVIIKVIFMLKIVIVVIIKVQDVKDSDSDIDLPGAGAGEQHHVLAHYVLHGHLRRDPHQRHSQLHNRLELILVLLCTGCEVHQFDSSSVQQNCQNTTHNSKNLFN